MAFVAWMELPGEESGPGNPLACPVSCPCEKLLKLCQRDNHLFQQLCCRRAAVLGFLDAAPELFNGLVKHSPPQQTLDILGLKADNKIKWMA